MRGKHSLYKARYDPAQLEKILDCYWDQDRRYVLSVLVKDRIPKTSASETQMFQHRERKLRRFESAAHISDS